MRQAGGPVASEPPSLKAVFPFSFGSTSWLFPAGIEENVVRAGGLFDEMELLLFQADHLPSREEMARVALLGGQTGLRFSVHLPLDIDIASASAPVRRRSMHVVERVFDLTRGLDPAAYIIHIKKDPHASHRSWRAGVADALAGMPGDHMKLCVETLHWDLREIDDVLSTCGCSVCIDVGHLILGGYDLDEAFRAFAGRIGTIHLHGVDRGKDHASLAHLGAGHAAAIRRFLSRTEYRGSVTLEVFSMRDYLDSIGALKRIAAPRGARAMGRTPRGAFPMWRAPGRKASWKEPGAAC